MTRHWNKWQRSKKSFQKGIQVKKKRIMQPFAMTPTKRHNVGITSLDACEPVVQRKTKEVVAGIEVRDGNGKSILKVRNEKKQKSRQRTSQKDGRVKEYGLTTAQFSSGDMEESSSDEDDKWKKYGYE